MNSPLLLTTLTLILAAPGGFAKSELETLRALCAEQERQIRQLEVENSNLRSDSHESPASKPPQEAKAAIKPSSTQTALASDSTYTVKAGDSIDKIARKVGMTPEKLAKANGLKSNAIIQPGQKLKITGVPTTVAAMPAVQNIVSAPAAPRASHEGKTHTVQQGETYFSISKKYKVRTEALMEANPEVKASAMRPGQIIKITSGSSTTTISAPAAKTKAPAEKPATPTPKTAELKATAPAKSEPAVADSSPPETKMAEAHPPASTVENTPGPAGAPPETKFRSVTIDDQTTYGEFAAKHGTDAERLNALNGLDLTTATVLAKGSELYVPATP